MSEPLEIGDALRAAREAKGWTLQDAANKLRLMVRQIEAMESEDYAALGQPVFARGFVRNYARLLGLEPEPLLERMAATGAVPPERVEPEPYSLEVSSGLSKALIGVLVVLGLLLAIPIALYWWLNSGDEDEPPAAPVAAKPATPPTPAPAMMPDTGASVPPPAAPAPMPAPAAALPGAAPSTPSAPAAGPASPPPASAAPEPKSEPVSKPAAAVPVAATPSAKSDALPPVVPEPIVAEPPENPYLPSTARTKSIRLQFDEDAWVQIRDGNGRTLHAMLNKAGSTVDLAGKPPFDFVVGNAANVRMTYGGRPFDIKPYIGETVARFTLE